MKRIAILTGLLAVLAAPIQAANPGKAKPMASNQTRELTVEKKYLLFPVKGGAKKCRMIVEPAGGEVLQFEIELGTQDKADFWGWIDLPRYGVKKITLKGVGASKEGFESIVQGDSIPGEEKFYTERLRPQFHFSQKVGWNNDPNGMVYSDGEYHLFFQHNPFGWKWGNMTWGHAVSKDMVHWTQLENALLPDKLGTMFSGTAAVDKNNTAGFKTGDKDVIVTAYTYAGQFGYPKCPFTQAIAYSNDNGRTFVKYKGNPVVKNLSGGSDRDPKILWHEATKKWVMVLYLANGRRFGFFTSDNLKEWKKESEMKGFHECPELFELPIDGDAKNTRWVIFDARAQYVIGSFDGKVFKPDHKGKHRLHYGRYYASQTFNQTKDGRRIQIGWGQISMNGMPFNQMMTFPTLLTLRKTPDGIRMFAKPVKEIEGIHGKKHTAKAQTIADGKEIAIGAAGDLFEIRAEFAAGQAQSFGIKVPGADVVYDAKAKSVTGGRVKAPLAPVDGKVRLQILIDRPSVEVCGNDGRIYITSPRGDRSKGKGVKVFARGGDAKLTSLEVYELKSIWPKPKTSK